MEIRQKNVVDLTPVEYRACWRANYGWDGYMQEELMRCRKGSQPGIAILLWEGRDDDIKSLIGWALLTPVRTEGLLAATPYIKKKAKYSVQFWVKKKYRRRGFGKALMNEVKKLDPRPHVFPHDYASVELFSSYDVTTLGADRSLLRRKPRIG